MDGFLFELWRQLKLHNIRDDTLSERQLLKIACEIYGYEFSKTRFKILRCINTNVNFAIDFAKTFPQYHEYVRHNIGVKQYNMFRWFDEFPNDDINVSDFIAHVETSTGAFRLAKYTNTPNTRLAHMITDKNVALEWVETFEQDIEYMRDIVKHGDDDFWVDSWNGLMDKLNEPEFKIY